MDLKNSNNQEEALSARGPYHKDSNTQKAKLMCQVANHTWAQE